MSADPASPSIDDLINATRSNLKKGVEESGIKISLSIPSVTFWIEQSNLLESVQQFVQAKNVSNIKPNSRINIELEFGIGDVVYKLVIRTIVGQNGVLSLRHSDIVDIDFPFTEKEQSAWELLKGYAKANALPIAGLVLSLINTSLNIMRLQPP